MYGDVADRNLKCGKTKVLDLKRFGKGFVSVKGQVFFSVWLFMRSYRPMLCLPDRHIVIPAYLF